LGMNEDFNIPNIHIYYNDDLHFAWMKWCAFEWVVCDCIQIWPVVI
jgi:hypothetical protein